MANSLADLELISYRAANSSTIGSLFDNEYTYFAAHSGLSGIRSLSDHQLAFYRANNGSIGTTVVEAEKAYYDAKEATCIPLVNYEDKAYNYFKLHGVFNA